MAILARDVMQTHVVTIEPDTSLLDAQRIFAEEEINGAPVMDSDGRVIGVVSARETWPSSRVPTGPTDLWISRIAPPRVRFPR